MFRRNVFKKFRKMFKIGRNRILLISILLFYLVTFAVFCVVKLLLKDLKQDPTARTRNIWAEAMRIDQSQPEPYPHKEYDIAVWGNKYIGSYLQYDILESSDNSFAMFENLRFHFHYGEKPDLVLRGAKIVIYIGNGRSKWHVLETAKFLDYIREIKNTGSSSFHTRMPLLGYTFKVGLILIGNELCDNRWLYKYKDILDFVFVTYNAKELSDKDMIFRWPLGVASYRSFPPAKSVDLNPDQQRPYFCNFIGTIYPNSSRYLLMEEIRQYNKTYKDNLLLKSCVIQTRDKWIPQETEHTAEFYQKTLLNSDFTLCPVGLNEETYRVYEALTMGSIPIIEDTPPNFKMPEHAGQENWCYGYPYDDHGTNDNNNYYNVKKIARAKAKRSAEKISGSFLFSDGSYFYDRNLGVIVTGDDEEDVAKFKRNIKLKPVERLKIHGLLKLHRAPVLFVDKIDVKMLKRLFSGLSRTTVQAWRRSLISWYGDFRSKFREKLADVISNVLVKKKK